jgi:hypothetical protein
VLEDGIQTSQVHPITGGEFDKKDGQCIGPHDQDDFVF